ncbi:MAG: hypothetical protein NC395_10350 [Prevotella sp.]|nr:hypothetical protein [Prevotella sp.]
MKKTIKKILALGAAAVMSVSCLCIAVSAEEPDTSPVSIDFIAEEQTESAKITVVRSGTYSNGSSYVALRADGTCYFHIVLVDNTYIRANGTYSSTDTYLGASCTSYMIVNSDGSVKESIHDTIGIDGTFSNGGTVLTISSIKYYKD